MIDPEFIEGPVVQWTVVFEFERADRMRDSFERVRDAVGIVVHRIDAPFVTGPVVLRPEYPKHHRVPHVDVARGHVDLRTQRAGAVFKLPGTHPSEKAEVLLDGTVPVRAVLSGFGQSAPVFPYLIRSEVADIG